MAFRVDVGQGLGQNSEKKMVSCRRELTVNNSVQQYNCTNDSNTDNNLKP